MSSPRPSESVAIDPEAVERADSAFGTDESAAGAERVDTADAVDHQPRWRRVMNRVPIELVVLAVLAAATRFAFLYNPRAIVFDEVYFREFALHYQQGTYYFDLHPPLGKLLLGAWAAIAGVDASPLGKDPAVAIRLLPALAGTALILVVYLLIRQLSRSRRIATLGAGLLLLDNAVLVESRFTFMDSMLLLFGISAVTFALAARQRTGRAYWLLLLGAIAFGALAMSIKLTGLSALGLVGLLWLVDVVRRRRSWRSILGQVALFAAIPVTIYVATFAIHFALLPKTGPGDWMMPDRFQATLVGNKHYRPDAHLSFFHKFSDLNGAIHRGEKSMNTVTHPYSSKWTSWPINKRGVYVWYANPGNAKGSYIYSIGNPVVWWGTLLGVLITAIGWVARPKRFRPYRWSLAFLALAWLANYLPFAFITRPMFLYHYFFALIFSLAFAVIGVGVLTGWINDGEAPPDEEDRVPDEEDRAPDGESSPPEAQAAAPEHQEVSVGEDDTPPENDPELDADESALDKQPESSGAPAKPFAFPSRWSAIGYWGLLGAAMLAFLYFAPITFGIPITSDGLDDRLWLSSWR